MSVENVDIRFRVSGINNIDRAHSSVKKLSTSSTALGKSLTTKVTLPVLGLGAAILKTTADFDAGMSKVQAISGATGDELLALRDKAKEMGEKTKFSATESAEAFNYMAMAGWKTQDMLNGIEGVMNLAAASGENLGTVSDIVTDGLTAMGLTAKDTQEFVDVLAAASSNSNTNVAMMGETFKYAAPIAGTLGYSIQDLAVSIGLMANAGIKASMAGTSLRSGLTRLAAPPKAAKEAMDKYKISITEASGEMKPLSTVIEELRTKFSGLSKQEQTNAANAIFGKTAMSGWLAVINATDKDLTKLTNAVDNSAGASENMASIMQNNLSGQLTILKSQLEGVAIKIGESLMPTVRELVAGLQGAVDWFSNLDEGTRNTIVKVVGLTAVVGPLLLVFGQVVTVGSSLIGLFSGVVGGMGAASAGAAGLAGALSLPAILTAGGVIAGIAGAGYLIYKGLQPAIEQVDVLGEGVSKSTKKALDSILDLNEKASDELTDFKINNTVITEETGNALKSSYDDLTKEIIEKVKERGKKELKAAEDLFKDSETLTVTHEEDILKKLEEANIKKEKKVEDNNKAIKTIIEKAEKEKRELYISEYREIEKLQADSLKVGVKNLTKNEQEQKVIWERIKNNASINSAEEAAAVVKNSKKQADKVIEDAEKTYNEKIATIIDLRDESKLITNEEAEYMIKEAERERDETVKAAKKRHLDIIEEAKKQAGEHIDTVDWETGEILSRWEVFGNDLADKAREVNDKLMAVLEPMATAVVGFLGDVLTNIGLIDSATEKAEKEAKQIKENKEKTDQYNKNRLDLVKYQNASFAPANPEKNWSNPSVTSSQGHSAANELSVTSMQGHALGTNFAPGGWSMINEGGPELVNLPRGSQVINNTTTNKILNNNGNTLHKVDVSGTIKVDVNGKTIKLQDQEVRKIVANAMTDNLNRFG